MKTDMTDGEAAAYVAAFVDGEGHVGCKKFKDRDVFHRAISVVNTDTDLIDAFVRCCTQLSIPTSVRSESQTRTNWKKKWSVAVVGGRASYERFKALIPLQASRKVAALDAILASYQEDPYASRKRREKRACVQCGAAFEKNLGALKHPGWGQYCSMACRGLADPRRAEDVSCGTCGVTFHAPPSRIKRRAGKPIYCSQRCSALTQTARLQRQAIYAARASATARKTKPWGPGRPRQS